MNDKIKHSIKAVVFDLDHTLFDRYATLRVLAPVIAEYFRAGLRREVTPEQLAQVMIEADRQWVQLGWEVMYEAICHQDIFLIPPSLEGFQGLVFQQFHTAAVPYPYVRGILEQLRRNGYRTGLITNGDGFLQRSKLRLLGLEDCFDYVLITGDYGTAKPDISVFYHMADCLDCRTNEMLYAGDHPVNDVDASRRAGCISVWIRTQGNWCFPEVERARYELDSVEQIPDLVRKIENCPEPES